MQSIAICLWVATGFVISALAQTTYTAQSAPFRLYLSSPDTLNKWNGHYLYACHVGAALEYLCSADGPFDSEPFYFNTTAANPPDNEPGVLSWYLFYNTNQKIASAMSIGGPLNSNVERAELSVVPSTDLVAFDQWGFMNMQPSGTPEYRWHICTNEYDSSTAYPSLSWVTGDVAPSDPSCIQISVIRQFV